MAILRWIHLIVVMHFVQIIITSDGKFYPASIHVLDITRKALDRLPSNDVMYDLLDLEL